MLLDQVFAEKHQPLQLSQDQGFLGASDLDLYIGLTVMPNDTLPTEERM